MVFARLLGCGSAAEDDGERGGGMREVLIRGRFRISKVGPHPPLSQAKRPFTGVNRNAKLLILRS